MLHNYSGLGNVFLIFFFNSFINWPENYIIIEVLNYKNRKNNTKKLLQQETKWKK